MQLLSIALLLFTLQDKPKAAIAVTDGTESVAPGETPASFKGDAAVSNGRITLVVPKNGGAAEIRSGGVARAKLSLVGAEKFDRVALVEPGKGGATRAVASQGAPVRL